MITQLFSFDEYEDFIEGFANDRCFSDPHYLYNRENLYGALQKENHLAFGTFEGNRITGIFVFLILAQEKYAEMMVGFSRDAAAYREILSYLKNKYRGYTLDFIINPDNYLLKNLLKEEGASFETEQQKMVWHEPIQIQKTHNIQLYSEQYREQYIALHSQNTYWTAEKVLNARDRFRVFLAIVNGRVVGYLDITYCFSENEPYDLMVEKAFLHHGYEKDLLAAAIEMNVPNGMMVLVDVDRPEEIDLYTSVGFVALRNQNCQAVHLPL